MRNLGLVNNLVATKLLNSIVYTNIILLFY